MEKTILILGIILLAVVIISLALIFLLSHKNTTPKVVELKTNESTTVNGLKLTNKSGGHRILIEGGDVSFADMELEVLGKKETVSMIAGGQQWWNGYLITVYNVGWDGALIKFDVKKVGEVKVNTDQAIEIVKKYGESQLHISHVDMEKIQISLIDNGGYYSVSMVPTAALKTYQGVIPALAVDKFSGEVSVK